MTAKNEGRGAAGKATHLPSKVVLKCTKVTKKFNTRKVINDCSITVHRGEAVAVFSPDGGGKTTLAKMICGLIRPSSGSVMIRGKKAGRSTNSMVSYLPEVPFVKYDSTILEMLTLYNRFFEDFRYKKAYRLLNELKINPKTKFDNLSSTAVQLVETILVASRKTSLYVFDEPLINVDDKYREDVVEIMEGCKKNGAVVVLSQNARPSLDRMIDRAIFMNKGDILLNGSRENIEAKYSQPLSTIYREVFK